VTNDPVLIRVSDLNLDLHNPRAAGLTFASEEDAIKFLIAEADLDEIITSICKSGWIDYEPFVVQKDGSIVLEGNRRLASLRLIADAALRDALGYKMPSTQCASVPEQVRAILVDGRDEARAYIAFKHINGPAKWGALAKAMYASAWIDSGVKIGDVASALGDTNNTIVRMVNGWRVLVQAKANGFKIEDITASRFNFSHLYTALSKPDFRRVLGMNDDLGVSVLPANPVPEDDLPKLREALGWMYGQKEWRSFAVVKSQNPDLTRLVQVMANTSAYAVLRDTNDLKVAFNVITPPESRFAEALAILVAKAEQANSLVGSFEPESQPDLIKQVNTLAAFVRTMRETMRAKIHAAEGDDL
jgi:hypothetical protein